MQKDLGAALRQGLADAAAGRAASAAAVFDRLEKKYRALGSKKVDSGSSPE